MDAVSDPLIEEVVVMKSAQVGWTEIINNIAAYFIVHDPCPIMVMQPTLEMAEGWSTDRLAPMVRDTPSLRAKISDAKSRDSGNKLLQKRFAGGQLVIVGANSPASLASRPMRVILADEVDRYPASAGVEGDPLTLAYKRTNNFWNRRKLAGSTPTIAGSSRIEAKFEESDKRFFFVPCGQCDEFQVLKWEQVRWDKTASGAHRADTAYYVCEHSGGVLGTVSAAGTTTTSGSDTVAVTLAAGLPVGVPVTGAGIPAGTTILSRPANGGAGSYVLSNAATASGTITMVASGVAAGSVVPANCTATTVGGATMSTSVVADVTGIGNNVILTPKFLAANDTVRLVSDITLANWSPGDILEAYAEIEVIGAINLKPIQLELSISGTNSSGAQVGPPTQDMNVGATTVGPDEDYILFERTKVVQIPTTMTNKAFMSVGLRCIAAQAAAAGATSIRIRRLVVNRLPALPY